MLREITNRSLKPTLVQLHEVQTKRLLSFVLGPQPQELAIKVDAPVFLAIARAVHIEHVSFLTLKRHLSWLKHLQSTDGQLPRVSVEWSHQSEQNQSINEHPSMMLQQQR